MQTVGIKALKNKLSEYIRAVAAGETVQVTDRGRVVAEIVALRVPDDVSTPQQKMAELVRQGLVTPARRTDGNPPPRVPVAPLAELMNELESDREDR